MKSIGARRIGVRPVSAKKVSAPTLGNVFGGGAPDMPPIWQQLVGGVADGTINTLNDLQNNLIAPKYVGTSCLEMPGASGDCIVNTGLQFNSDTDTLEIWGQVRTGELQGLDFIYGAESASKTIGLGMGATDWIADIGSKGVGATGVAFDGNPHRWVVSGNILTMYDLDGTNPTVLKDRSTQESFTVPFDLIFGARNRSGSVSEESPIDIFYTKWVRNGVVIQEATYGEGSGVIAYDRSASQNDIDLQEADFSPAVNPCLAAVRAGTTDIGIPYNIKNAHHLSGGVRYPSQSASSTLDVLGNPITLGTSQRVQNGAESKVRQFDPYFTGGTVSFYSADGVSVDDKSYADYLNHYDTENGKYNLWVAVDPNMNILKADQFKLDAVFTQEQFLYAVSQYGGTPEPQ